MYMNMYIYFVKNVSTRAHQVIYQFFKWNKKWKVVLVTRKVSWLLIISSLKKQKAVFFKNNVHVHERRNLHDTCKYICRSEARWKNGYIKVIIKKKSFVNLLFLIHLQEDAHNIKHNKINYLEGIAIFILFYSHYKHHLQELLSKCQLMISISIKLLWNNKHISLMRTTAWTIYLY